MNRHEERQGLRLTVAMLALVVVSGALSLASAGALAATRPKQETGVGTVVRAGEISVCQQGATHLLMQGDALSILWTTVVSMLAVAALAVVTGGWLLGPASPLVRALCVPAAALLLYLQPFSIGVGLAFLAAAVGTAYLTRHGTPTAPDRSNQETTT